MAAAAPWRSYGVMAGAGWWLSGSYFRIFRRAAWRHHVFCGDVAVALRRAICGRNREMPANKLALAGKCSGCRKRPYVTRRYKYSKWLLKQKRRAQIPRGEIIRALAWLAAGAWLSRVAWLSGQNISSP
jgi:hypothetical protein